MCDLHLHNLGGYSYSNRRQKRHNRPTSLYLQLHRAVHRQTEIQQDWLWKPPHYKIHRYYRHIHEHTSSQQHLRLLPSIRPMGISHIVLSTKSFRHLPSSSLSHSLRQPRCVWFRTNEWVIHCFYSVTTQCLPRRFYEQQKHEPGFWKSRKVCYDSS